MLERSRRTLLVDGVRLGLGDRDRGRTGVDVARANLRCRHRADGADDHTAAAIGDGRAGSDGFQRVRTTLLMVSHDLGDLAFEAAVVDLSDGGLLNRVVSQDNGRHGRGEGLRLAAGREHSEDREDDDDTRAGGNELLHSENSWLGIFPAHAE